MADTKNWREIRNQRALNEEQVSGYRLLMRAQARLHELRRARARAGATIAEALPDTLGELPEDDLGALIALARQVAALGGELELRANFPDASLTLLHGAELLDPDADPAAQ